MDEKYMIMTVGGKWEFSWEKVPRKVYSSKEQAIAELQDIMVAAGCKRKNLLVMYTDHSNKSHKSTIVEVRNRHKADEDKYSKDIPRTGYIYTVEMV